MGGMQEDISEQSKTCCVADVTEERELVKPALFLNLHSQGVEVSPVTRSLVVQGEELWKRFPGSMGSILSFPNTAAFRQGASRPTSRSP